MIFATRNQHKIAEVGHILGSDPEPLPPEIEMPPETEDTFAGNALIKARAARDATGRTVAADDSGIEVEALGGKPGVRSARYAGEHASDGENLEKALRDLESSGGVPDARYVCVIAYIDDAGREHLFEGTCGGRLTQATRGQGGFGYDPAFIPDDTGADDDRTMAELSATEKHEISHRGRAVRALAAFLESGSTTPGRRSARD